MEDILITVVLYLCVHVYVREREEGCSLNKLVRGAIYHFNVASHQAFAADYSQPFCFNTEYWRR